MHLKDQHFRDHFKSYKLLTNNENLINNKDCIQNLIVILKPQTMKIIFIDNKIRSTIQKSQHTFAGTNP
jgi:hypothetical protein